MQESIIDVNFIPLYFPLLLTSIFNFANVVFLVHLLVLSSRKRVNDLETGVGSSFKYRKKFDAQLKCCRIGQLGFCTWLSLWALLLPLLSGFEVAIPIEYSNLTSDSSRQRLTISNLLFSPLG